jgi:hypothetical protein
VKVSKRTVAREWLIFLPLFVLGGIISFFVAYYWNGVTPGDPYRVLQPPLRDSYDAFWNDSFGFNCSPKPYFDPDLPRYLWFAPYLGVMLIRSIWWSIKTLRMPRNHWKHE